MSLLEDVFLQDEANEAQELERVIEGDEFEERPRSDSDDNSEKEDEAEEEKTRVDPNSTKTRRVIKNPRFILNPARLTGPRGIQVLPDHFKDFKFKGKGHEKEDLDLVLKKLEHWAYRLYPKFQFEDCLKKIEMLGKKRPVMVHLHKIRTDQLLSEETVVQKDSSDEEEPPPQEDEFDKLLQQQIELARSTPAPSSVKKNLDSAMKENRPLMIPKATSSPSISDEQKERMLRNRKLAEERRLARLKNASNATLNMSQEQNNTSTNDKTHINGNALVNINENVIEIDDSDAPTVKKHNKINVIDSSDEDEGITAVNESITVDVHNLGTQSNENEIGGNSLDNDHDKDKNSENHDEIESVINTEVSEEISSSINCKENVIKSTDIEINEKNTQPNDGLNEEAIREKEENNEITAVDNKGNCHATTEQQENNDVVDQNDKELLMDVDFNDDI